MRRWLTKDEGETRAVGAEVWRELDPSGVVLLSGELAAGKTVLVQGIAAAMGIDPKEVQSPTFTLVREHEGSGGRLVHCDLYRLEPSEVAAAGIEEQLSAEGIVAVEWAERLPWTVEGALRLELEILEDGSRSIREVVG